MILCDTSPFIKSWLSILRGSLLLIESREAKKAPQEEEDSREKNHIRRKKWCCESETKKNKGWWKWLNQITKILITRMLISKKYFETGKIIPARVTNISVSEQKKYKSN